MQNLILILLASPGVRSDSCKTTGILSNLAATQTGTLTNPPFEKTKFGFSFFNINKESTIPFITLNGSIKFSQEKYLLNLPELIL